MFMKYFTLLILIFTGFGCHNHDDDNNTVVIDILRPEEGGVILNPSKTDIWINFTATGELHEIEVELYEKDERDEKIFYFEKHVHDKRFEFRETLDLSSFQKGTFFDLEVKVCLDEKCNSFVTEEVTFSN